MRRGASDCATFERVDSFIRYVPLTGKFYWKVSRGPGAIDSEAGCRNKVTGYVYITIDGKSYGAHQVAHLLMTGHWPIGEPDHANLDRADNRWENICDLVTESEQKGHRDTPRNNTSGFKGVYWAKQAKKWRAQIQVRKNHILLGYFDDLREAALVHDAAAKMVWQRRFARLNFPWGDSDSIVLSERVLRVIESIGG